MNDTCVVERECKKCDEVHFSGDSWFESTCRKCVCNSDGHISCINTLCPDVICGVGEKLVVIPGGDDICCKKFRCVPNCETYIIPDCSENQVNTQYNDTNGCLVNICGKN